MSHCYVIAIVLKMKKKKWRKKQQIIHKHFREWYLPLLRIIPYVICFHLHIARTPMSHGLSLGCSIRSASHDHLVLQCRMPSFQRAPIPIPNQPSALDGPRLYEVSAILYQCVHMFTLSQVHLEPNIWIAPRKRKMCVTHVLSRSKTKNGPCILNSQRATLDAQRRPF